MTLEPDRREREKGLIAIAAVTVLWAANFVLARPAAVRFDPFLLTFVRALVAALVFTAMVARGAGRGHLNLANLGRAVPLAIACIVGNQVLFLVASRLTTPSHVALVIATIPIFVAMLASLTIAERLAPLRWLGILVAFAGVVLLALTRFPGGTKQPSALGDSLALLAAIAFAVFTVLNKSLVARVGSMAATALLYLAGTLLLLPLALWRSWSLPARPYELLELGSAAYLVVGATLLAYPLFAYALARLSASRVAVFTYLQPLLAASMSYAIGWERYSTGTLLAATLTVLGVALAQKRR